jgi:hypothetical protein
MKATVGMATGYGLADRDVGFRVPVGEELSFFHVVPNGLKPTKTPNKWVKRDYFSGVKRHRLETNQSLAASNDVKKREYMHSFPHTLYCT